MASSFRGCLKDLGSLGFDFEKKRSLGEPKFRYLQWQSRSPCGGDSSPAMCRGRSTEVCIGLTTAKKTADSFSARRRGTTVIDSAGEVCQLGPACKRRPCAPYGKDVLDQKSSSARKRPCCGHCPVGRRRWRSQIRPARNWHSEKTPALGTDVGQRAT